MRVCVINIFAEEAPLHRIRSAVLLLACVTQAGCFHQVFDTGLAPSSTVVRKGWHPTFIFGLVAGQPVDVRSECPSGVAIASTRMTFANGLVGGLTLGLYSPHEVKVVCAARTAVLPGMETRHLAASMTQNEVMRVLAEAIDSASRHAEGVALITDVPAATSTDSQETSR
jgi:hypothetical protein